jgi:hypothetical protein
MKVLVTTSNSRKTCEQTLVKCTAWAATQAHSARALCITRCYQPPMFIRHKQSSSTPPQPLRRMQPYPPYTATNPHRSSIPSDFPAISLQNSPPAAEWQSCAPAPPGLRCLCKKQCENTATMGPQRRAQPFGMNQRAKCRKGTSLPIIVNANVGHFNLQILAHLAGEEDPVTLCTSARGVVCDSGFRFGFGSFIIAICNFEPCLCSRARAWSSVRPSRCTQRCSCRASSLQATTTL